MQRFFYTLILLLKFFIGCQIIYYILNFLSPFRWYWHVMLSVVLVVMLIRSRRVKLWSIRIQRTFMQNLNSREEMRQKSNPAYGRKLRGKELHIASLTLPLNTAWGGSTLSQLKIGSMDNVHVVAIADHDTPFTTIKVPSAGSLQPYVYLCAGWNVLVEIGIAEGINLDKPTRARKVGNEIQG